eukprot:3510871-Prymnesium_polylepis.1
MSACTGQLHAGVTAHAPSRPFTCGHRRTSAARAVTCLQCESSERPNLSCGGPTSRAVAPPRQALQQRIAA